MVKPRKNSWTKKKIIIQVLGSNLALLKWDTCQWVKAFKLTFFLNSTSRVSKSLLEHLLLSKPYFCCFIISSWKLNFIVCFRWGPQPWTPWSTEGTSLPVCTPRQQRRPSRTEQIPATPPTPSPTTRCPRAAASSISTPARSCTGLTGARCSSSNRTPATWRPPATRRTPSAGATSTLSRGPDMGSRSRGSPTRPTQLAVAGPLRTHLTPAATTSLAAAATTTATVKTWCWGPKPGTTRPVSGATTLTTKQLPCKLTTTVRTCFRECQVGTEQGCPAAALPRPCPTRLRWQGQVCRPCCRWRRSWVSTRRQPAATTLRRPRQLLQRRLPANTGDLCRSFSRSIGRNNFKHSTLRRSFRRSHFRWRFLSLWPKIQWKSHKLIFF